MVFLSLKLALDLAADSLFPLGHLFLVSCSVGGLNNCAVVLDLLLCMVHDQ